MIYIAYIVLLITIVGLPLYFFYIKDRNAKKAALIAKSTPPEKVTIADLTARKDTFFLEATDRKFMFCPRNFLSDLYAADVQKGHCGDLYHTENSEGAWLSIGSANFWGIIKEVQSFTEPLDMI